MLKVATLTIHETVDTSSTRKPRPDYFFKNAHLTGTLANSMSARIQHAARFLSSTVATYLRRGNDTVVAMRVTGHHPKARPRTWSRSVSFSGTLANSMSPDIVYAARLSQALVMPIHSHNTPNTPSYHAWLTIIPG